MAARVVHFGCDPCRRLLVLHMAGYAIDDCPSVLNLGFALQDNQAAAVVFTGQNENERKEAVTLARSQSSAPLILFEASNSPTDEADFDLVIPPLTPPQEWLDKIAATIQQRRILH
jgi:hypothetical protein